MSMRRKEVSQDSSIAVQDNVIGLADGYANPFTKAKGVPMQMAAPAVPVPAAAGGRVVDLGVPVKMNIVHGKDRRAAEMAFRNNSIFDKLALVAQHATGRTPVHSLNNVKKYISKNGENKRYLQETKESIRKMLMEANGGDCSLTFMHITNGMYDEDDAKIFYKLVGKSIIDLYIQASDMIAKLEFEKQKESGKNKKEGMKPGKAAKQIRERNNPPNKIPVKNEQLPKNAWEKKKAEFLNDPNNPNWKKDPYIKQLLFVKRVADKNKKRMTNGSEDLQRVPSTADA